MDTFLLDYSHEGSTYTIDLMAKDWEDAEARLAAIRESGVIEGRLVERIDGSASLDAPITLLKIEGRAGAGHRFISGRR